MPVNNNKLSLANIADSYMQNHFISRNQLTTCYTTWDQFAKG